MWGLCPPVANAWKPTAHQLNSRATAYRIGHDTTMPIELRQILWERERCVRAGSMGPDRSIARLHSDATGAWERMYGLPFQAAANHKMLGLPIGTPQE
jgi:hypothetical protein